MPPLPLRNSAPCSAAVFLALFLCSALNAQSSSTPDTGPGGEFAVKSWSAAGSGFDTFTGIGRRSVTDLVVPGALFDDGLKFTRYTATSGGSIRQPIEPEPTPTIGYGRHNFQYEATDEVDSGGGDGAAAYEKYTIYLKTPDGRTYSASYSVYNGPLVIPNGWFGFNPSYTFDNTAEKFRVTGTGAYNATEFTFHEPDGTQVEMRYLGSATATWVPTRIIDPSGRALTLEYEGGDRLVRVSDAAGRYLKVTWSNVNGSWYGTQVESGRRDGGNDTPWQQVGYAPAQNGGTAAYYYSEGQWPQNPVIGTYIPDAPNNGATCLDDYRNNIGPANLPGLWTYEPHFEGPMTRLHQRNPNTYGTYPCRWAPSDRAPCPEWYSQQGPNPVYRPAQWTYEERSGTTDQLVVRWDWMCREPGPTPQEYLTHSRTVEKRGDGPTRQWWWGHWPNEEPDPDPVYTYPNGVQQAPRFSMHYRVTDWSLDVSDTARQTRVMTERYGAPGRVYDARNYRQQADYTRHSGKVVKVLNADRATFRTWEYDNPDAPGQDPIWSVYEAFLHRKTDERGFQTRYRRDALNRVWNIEYLDGSNNGAGSSEGFAYNGFGQVTVHRLGSGTHEHFDYDARGLLWRSYDDVEGIGSAKIYTYDTLDRVATVQDGRARASGAPYSVRLEYNGRHQITKCHYPSTGGSADPTVTYGYDNDGNCTSITDELGQWRTFEYDEYRRCTRMTEQLDAANWNGTATVASRSWDWIYDRVYTLRDAQGNFTTQGFAPTSHTDKQWRIQLEPAFNAAGDRRMTVQYFDLNNRVATVQTGWVQPAQGNWYFGADGAETIASFDAVGNKVATRDAMGRWTTYDYDARNRLTATHEPMSRNTLIELDAVGNKTKVTFPDNTTQRWQGFDMWGQANTFYDERNNLTTFAYFPWGPMRKRSQVVTYRTTSGGAPRRR